MRVSQGDLILLLDAEAEDEDEDASESVDADPAATAASSERASAPATAEPSDTPVAPPAAAAPPAETGSSHPVSGGAGTLPPIDEQSFSQAHASPSVRKFARELGVDLGQVKGSGQKGRVVQTDIKAFVKAILTGQGGAATGPAWPSLPKVDFAKFGEIEIKPLTRIQKISGPRLHASWVNSPHVTQNDEADITDLEERRQKLKTAAAENGVRLTPLAFIIKACVIALKEFPVFNTSLAQDGENLVYKNYFHIGFAADTPNGLLVPVIRDADLKDVMSIAAELGELSEKARTGKLAMQEMQGGTFTVSSLGGIGGTTFTPIINAPEVAILGVGRSDFKPVLKGKKFVPRLKLPLSLSYDHRVIDGATGVRFTTYLAGVLADVDRLLLGS
jgi:pyruvate dehydrogenase E2 component (dihydrolipoamide acetyltransferase)